MAKTNEKEISCFILEGEMKGLECGKNENKMGWNVQATRLVSFDDVKVPKENLLGKIG